jgi:Histidine kinase-, DNA gyrase B-, and HSP90-like ATPase
MKNKVSVSNNGIESSGIIRDYMDAIAELIWNGFDAEAKNIKIDFSANEIDTINEIKIIDDGKGIDFSTLDETFGNFNDSIKKNTYQKTSSSIRGHKGKGRFSFAAFSGLAKWHTIYEDKNENKKLEYDISISKNSKDIYDAENTKISKATSTGTTLILKDLFEVTGYSFTSDSFVNHLAKEFGWFLLLNKEQSFSIKINNNEVEYENLIAESEVRPLTIKSADGINQDFKITFIRWNENIGDKFYFYYLNSSQIELFKELTSYNNNAIGFYHSVYIESKYFDNFVPSDKVENNNLFEDSKNSGVFKTLKTHLHSLVREKEKIFLHDGAAQNLIDTYEKNGVIPKFGKNKYEQARKKDLIDVVKGIYCIEPKVFQGLNKEQQKVSVGLINLLLDTDERESITEIIGQIVKLTTDERLQLAEILKKTTVSKISKTINLIENRYKIIELLKILVFDLQKFTNERDHIQKVIQENYWLFGEQYHLASANEGFDVLLSRYTEFLSKSDGKSTDKKKSNSDDSNRRPDIFVCRKHTIPDSRDNETMMEENLIVELKRPTVTIGTKELRQVEDYLEIIRNDPAFNSDKRCWKFFVVSNKVDEYVKGQYESEKNKGKKFLVKALFNFEIYAFTWDDVFMLFDLRHKFLVDNLEFDKKIIIAELLEKKIDIFGHQASEIISKSIIDISRKENLN